MFKFGAKRKTITETVIKAWLFIATALCLGCGVKGDPVPPVTPAEIGRGKPAKKPAADTQSAIKDQERVIDPDESDDEDEDSSDD